MKTTYEIVWIEENKIFIIPNISEKIIIESRTTINSFCDHVYKNWGRNVEIIFGFRKFSFSKKLEYEWKVVRHQKTGPFWGFDYFKNYEGHTPEESEITGFPSSHLFNL
jgi:hypothetical protein